MASAQLASSFPTESPPKRARRDDENNSDDKREAADDMGSQGFEVRVRTGDVKGAGTDANVWITLHGKGDVRSRRVKLDNFFRNDFKKGNEDVFIISATESGDVREVTAITLERDDWGIKPEWFVEKVTVKPKEQQQQEYVFPLHRWVTSGGNHVIEHLDTCLPEDDPRPQQRAQLLEEARVRYTPRHQGDLPVQVADVPPEEQFSFDIKWDITSRKMELIAKSRIRGLFLSSNLKRFDDFLKIYSPDDFYKPEGIKLFREDWYFGFQRLNGPNPTSIQLCTALPSKLAVTEEMLQPLLEGLSLQEALNQRRLFLVDHKVLLKVASTADVPVCTPIALFFVNSKTQLVPVAIQLHQEPGPQNPVFLPKDNKHTWLLAKMWFNNADAIVHQSLTHLGFTHLIMEGFALSSKRQLSLSHPLHRLLAPHFLYIMMINQRAVQKLLAEGGWIDKVISVGKDGVLGIIAQEARTWRLDVEGNLPADLKRRGLLDKDVLPGFHYRDDALLLYDVIRDYVTEYVNLYYESEEAVQRDVEVQAWAKELATPKTELGMGIQGIPGNGVLTSRDDVILMATCIIFTCSVQHAAVNFPQYDCYGFPPNYPAFPQGQPPRDKKARTEEDTVAALPTKDACLDIMVVIKILSEKGTNCLGDFEVNYIADPRAEVIAQRFRDRLQEVGEKIAEACKTRYPAYDHLHPSHIPNSIAI